MKSRSQSSHGLTRIKTCWFFALLAPSRCARIVHGTLFALLFVFIFVPSFAFAQTDYQLLAPLQDGQTTLRIGGQGESSLPGYLRTLYRTGVAIAGVLAVLMLVWGGFKYATSEAVLGKGEGKEIVWNVVVGGAIVLGSYLLLVTINPRLVDIGLSLDPLTAVTKQNRLNATSRYDQILQQRFNSMHKSAGQANKDYADAVAQINRDLQDGKITPEQAAARTLQADYVREQKGAEQLVHLTTSRVIDLVRTSPAQTPEQEAALIKRITDVADREIADLLKYQRITNPNITEETSLEAQAVRTFTATQIPLVRQAVVDMKKEREGERKQQIDTSMIIQG